MKTPDQVLVDADKGNWSGTEEELEALRTAITQRDDNQLCLEKTIRISSECVDERNQFHALLIRVRDILSFDQWPEQAAIQEMYGMLAELAAIPSIGPGPWLEGWHKMTDHQGEMVKAGLLPEKAKDDN